MAHAFELSHAAYARKDGAGAKELSNEGKANQREMERLNAEASAWIFRGELLFVFVSCKESSRIHATPPSFAENNRVWVFLVLGQMILSMTLSGNALSGLQPGGN